MIMATTIAHRIRPASTADADAIGKLYEAQANLHFDLMPFATRNEALDWTAYVSRRLSGSNQAIFVADADATISGFIYVRITGLSKKPTPRQRLKHWLRPKKRSGDNPIVKEPVGYIEDCFVLETNRQCGMGAALVKAAMDWFKSQKVSRVALSVQNNNDPALTFWSKLGFETYRQLMHREV